MSNKKHTGGPAFPSGESYYTTDLAGNRTRHGKSPHFEGMTLRDYFAAKAMQGLIIGCIQKNYSDNIEDWAANSYAVADAMLVERTKGE